MGNSEEIMKASRQNYFFTFDVTEYLLQDNVYVDWRQSMYTKV